MSEYPGILFSTLLQQSDRLSWCYCRRMIDTRLIKSAAEIWRDWVSVPETFGLVVIYGYDVAPRAIYARTSAVSRHLIHISASWIGVAGRVGLGSILTLVTENANRKSTAAPARIECCPYEPDHTNKSILRFSRLAVNPTLGTLAKFRARCKRPRRTSYWRVGLTDRILELLPSSNVSHTYIRGERLEITVKPRAWKLGRRHLRFTEI